MRLDAAKVVLLIAPILFAMLWFSGCFSFPHRAKLVSFKEVSKNYRFAILLSDFDQAAQVSQADYTLDDEPLANYHVVSYDLKRIEFSKDKSEVIQVVEIEYYRVDSMRQKKLRDVQQWSYRPEDEQWVLSSGLPQFN